MTLSCLSNYFACYQSRSYKNETNSATCRAPLFRKLKYNANSKAICAWLALNLTGSPKLIGIFWFWQISPAWGRTTYLNWWNFEHCIFGKGARDQRGQDIAVFKRNGSLPWPFTLMRKVVKTQLQSLGWGVTPSNVHFIEILYLASKPMFFTKVCCSCYVGIWLTYFYCIQKVSGSNSSGITDVENIVNERSLFLFYLPYMVYNLSAIPQRVFDEMSGLHQ